MTRFLLTLLVVLLLPTHPAPAQELVGRVVGIADGDTLTLLTPAQQQVRVRLAEIDTPERAQPYGTRARQELADLAFQKPARVTVQDIDRYGRTVERVHVDGVDINAEMVRRGAAWVYRQYNRDPTLLALEEHARAARAGLWGLPEAQRLPPWDWRRAGRAQSPASAAEGARPARSDTTDGTAALTCGPKRFCKQMSSCREARFYLSQCGLARLDGDGDGVPCESLCR